MKNTNCSRLLTGGILLLRREWLLSHQSLGRWLHRLKSLGRWLLRWLHSRSLWLHLRRTVLGGLDRGSLSWFLGRRFMLRLPMMQPMLLLKKLRRSRVHPLLKMLLLKRSKLRSSGRLLLRGFRGGDPCINWATAMLFRLVPL
jgi:hypothetical protein